MVFFRQPGRSLSNFRQSDFQNSDIIKILSDCTKIELVVNKRSDRVMRDLTDKVWETGKVNYDGFDNEAQELSICFTNRLRKKLNKRMMGSARTRPRLQQAELERRSTLL